MLDYVKHLLYLAELRPLKSAVAGALSAFVNIGLLHLLVLWGLPVHLASPIAIEASIPSNFASNVMWTFGDRRGRGWARRCLKYHLTVLLEAIVNYVVLLLLIALGLPYLVANMTGILLGHLANYSTSRGFVRVQRGKPFEEMK